MKSISKFSIFFLCFNITLCENFFFNKMIELKIKTFFIKNFVPYIKDDIFKKKYIKTLSVNFTSTKRIFVKKKILFYTYMYKLLYSEYLWKIKKIFSVNLFFFFVNISKAKSKWQFVYIKKKFYLKFCPQRYI